MNKWFLSAWESYSFSSIRDMQVIDFDHSRGFTREICMYTVSWVTYYIFLDYRSGFLL